MVTSIWKPSKGHLEEAGTLFFLLDIITKRGTTKTKPAMGVSTLLT